MFTKVESTGSKPIREIVLHELRNAIIENTRLYQAIF